MFSETLEDTQTTATDGGARSDEDGSVDKTRTRTDTHTHTWQALAVAGEDEGHVC